MTRPLYGVNDDDAYEVANQIANAMGCRVLKPIDDRSTFTWAAKIVSDCLECRRGWWMTGPLCFCNKHLEVPEIRVHVEEIARQRKSQGRPSRPSMEHDARWGS